MRGGGNAPSKNESEGTSFVRRRFRPPDKRHALFDPPSIDTSDVLINEDGVAVGIHHHETCRPGCAFVGFAH